MKNIGFLIAALGSLICIIYPPFENGSWSGYAFIWQQFQTFFGAMKVVDWINIQQLGLQLIVVNIIGFGLAIVGTLQEKNSPQ